MIAIVHALAGAVIGIVLPTLPAVAAVAFFLHYLMDLLPHIDTETFSSKGVPHSWAQTIILVIDGIGTAVLTVALFYIHERWAAIVVGALASLAPDLLIPLEKYSWFKPFRIFHDAFHWDTHRAKYWSWYIAGLVTPTIIAALSTVILWWSL